MTINGKPVCEVDVRASALTIFQASVGQPLDFSNNPDLDPYALPELDRDVVKAFITVTFGNGQCPVRWSAEAAEEYEKKKGQSLRLHHPISKVRDAVRKAYPLLGDLRRDKAHVDCRAPRSRLSGPDCSSSKVRLCCRLCSLSGQQGYPAFPYTTASLFHATMPSWQAIPYVRCTGSLQGLHPASPSATTTVILPTTMTITPGKDAEAV
jgi:hypothetical protein